MTPLQNIKNIIEKVNVPDPLKTNLIQLITELNYTPENLGNEIGTVISLLKKFRNDSDFYPL